MNSVLARIAQRALGVLPTAEPLKASRYQQEPRGAGFAPRQEVGSPLAFGSDLEAKPLAFESDSEAEVAPAPRTTTAVPPRASPPLPARADIFTPDRRGEDPLGEAPMREARAVEATLAAEASKRFERANPEAKSAVRPVAPVRRHDNEQASPSPFAPMAFVTRSRVSVDEPPPYVDPETEREAHRAKRDVASVPMPRRAARASVTPSRAASSAQRVEPAANSPVVAKTEIHISIGAVELRAPRPEPKPAAQPFRPRISLEEFLRREPGTSG